MACLRAEIWAAVGLCLIAGGAGAKPGTPGPDYFAGIYERVGRDGTGALLNDLVSIAPGGAGVVITACSGLPIDMAFGPAFEIVNLMSGMQGDDQVECLFHNNGYNYPILTCRTSGGAVFTLWPKENLDKAC